ncbi:MAG: YciI family protein [Betaproteobacteria bacterium]
MHRTILRSLLLILAWVGFTSTLVYAQSEPKRQPQFIVMHTPGSAWKAGVPPFEQEGLRQHVAHYAEFLKQGKLVMGGPFLDAESGGIMIAEPGISEQELQAFAASDPAVQSGLLKFRVRPWLVGLRK